MASPSHPSFAGYETAITEQGRNLVTSMIIALGTVVFSLADRDPGRIRARAVPVPLDQRSRCSRC